MCTLRVLVSASCATRALLHSTLLPQAGAEVLQLPMAKSSLTASHSQGPKPWPRSSPSLSLPVAVAMCLLAVHETSISGAWECLVLAERPLLPLLAWPPDGQDLTQAALSSSPHPSVHLNPALCSLPVRLCSFPA